MTAEMDHAEGAPSRNAGAVNPAWESLPAELGLSLWGDLSEIADMPPLTAAIWRVLCEHIAAYPEKIAARARAAEREEIAAAFEGPVCGENSRRIAAAIRARGETT